MTRPKTTERKHFGPIRGKQRHPCARWATLLRVAFVPLLIASGSCLPQRAKPAQNLVIVCIDTLRADHLKSYGYHRPTAPHLDALAAAGTLLERATAHSPWTVPATASLLTSLLPSEHGAGLAGEVKNLSQATPSQPLETVESLAQILQQAGFQTALFSGNPFLFGRFHKGFDFVEVNRQNATSLTDKAAAWLHPEPEQRFFLYLQYIDLHAPIAPPEPYFNFFPVEEGGERNQRHEDWAFARQEDWSAVDFRRFKAHKIALYDGALRYVDSEIDRLLGLLAEMGSLEETLVVITSDHGEEFWDHADIGRQLGNDPRDIWGVGHGHTMYQELLHVPLVFNGPGVASNRRLACEIGHVDVVPTVLELLGLERTPAMRGRSLVPLISEGSAPDPCPASPILAESPAYGPDSRAVIWRGHKLIERQDGVTLLYDLRSDPDEQHDLAAALPHQVEGLRSLLNHQLTSSEPSQGGLTMELDEETREQLRSLGYLGGKPEK